VNPSYVVLYVVRGEVPSGQKQRNPNKKVPRATTPDVGLRNVRTLLRMT
jgi:hypothetical protein